VDLVTKIGQHVECSGPHKFVIVNQQVGCVTVI
jgi:hypothetical protein